MSNPSTPSTSSALSTPAVATGFAPPPLAARWIGAAGMVAAAALLIYQLCVNPSATLADELGHLLVARDAWTRPEMIFNTWGRTANTLLFMPVAWLPLVAARLWAVAMSLAVCGLAWSFARRVGLRLACLVPWLIVLQPLFLRYGWGAVTMIPFSLALIGAAWLAQSGRWRWAALAAGLLPLIRHEGIALTAAFAALCLARRDARAALAAALPLVLLNLAAWVSIHRWPILVYFDPRPTAYYGSGGVRAFLGGFAREAGLLTPLLAALGLAMRPRRAALLLLGGAAGFYFLIHAVIFRFGLYASGGYLSFLWPLTPCMAILAAAGVEGLLSRLPASAATSSPRREGAWLAALLVLVALAGLMRQPFLPMAPSPEYAGLRSAIAYLRAHRLERRDIVAVHPLFFYDMPRPVPNTDACLWINMRPLAKLPSGAIVVWDSNFGDLFGLPLAELRRPGGPWRELWTAPGAAIFEKQPETTRPTGH